MTSLTGTSTPGIIELPLEASDRVRDALAAIGRTEDLRFSPGSTRLAIAGFAQARLLVLDVAITPGDERPRVSLTGGLVLTSTALHAPHGVDFVDERTLIVANRGGDVTFFALPDGTDVVPVRELAPLRTWTGGGAGLLNGPGSVAVTRLDAGSAEVLVCNNHAHTVTRHLVAEGDAGTARDRVLLHKWLDIPDGVAVSRDRRWIAVSNHTTHDILLYERGPALTPDSDPDGILRGVHYPHGVRFTDDGRFLFVADAGAPFVQLFAGDPDGWRGVRHPVASLRVMPDGTFKQGAQRVDEGGPKGLDIDPGMQVLAVTSKFQPLALFDLRALLALVDDRNPLRHREQHAANVAYELGYIAEHRVTKAKAIEAEYMKLSRAWQMTAPLRRLHAWMKNRRSSTDGGRRKT